MGKLVEQAIATLFGGVSKQPASIRLPNQVEAADNALMSVVTGGFEKRPPTQIISPLTFLDPTKEFATHVVDRDVTEQTFLVANNAGVQAFNAITGAQITVAILDSKKHFLIEEVDLDNTGIISTQAFVKLQFDSAETTLTWTYALSDSNTIFKIEGSVDNSSWNDIATGKTGSSGSFSTTIGAVATGDHNYVRINITGAAGNDTATMTLTAVFKDTTYLLGADEDDLQFATVADTTFIVNRTVTALMAEADSGTVTSTVQEFSDLPATSGSGNIHRVTGTDLDGFGTFYVIDDTTTSTWLETVDPNAHNAFAASTMPHMFSRLSDGTYTFKSAPWVDRDAGDEDINEAPPFIDKKIQDLTFYRNRLTFIADETSYTTQVGEVFTFWPEKAVDVLDTDPVSRSATTTDVNILKFATVFKKILFVTSERAQFELTSDGAFTPESALFDLSTTYAASTIAKPKALGDVLYFPAKTNDHAVFYEYFFDETSLANTAADISKHVVDYIPNDIMSIAADPATGTVFVLSTGEQNVLFVYRTFFDGSKKLQSAWARYIFGATESDALIHGMAVLSGFLVLIIERDDGVIYLEQAPVEREAQDATVGYTPFIDQREVVTGSYTNAHDVTHWDLSYEHTDDAVLILGPSFSEAGRQPTMLYPDRYQLTLATVLANETVIINGLTFTAHATTTTTANREFSIQGTNAQDATELAVVINDGTDGVPGVTATANGDGTITLNVDDKADGTITSPTGTAVSNATLTVVELDDIVAVRTDLSTGSVWVGRPYTMTVVLSEQFLREKEGGSIITGRLQLRDFTFSVVNTGYIKITVAPTHRDVYEYPFEGKVLGEGTTLIGSASIVERASIKTPVWARSSQVTITVSSDQPQPVEVTSAAWRGFFNELSRQE